MATASDLPRYEIVDFGLLETDSSKAIAINNAGQVLGKFTDRGQPHIFLWDSKSGLKILELPNDSSCLKLNNNGQIAGVHGGGKKVFFWDPATGFFDIGSFDDKYKRVDEFNDKAQILFSSLDHSHESREYYNGKDCPIFLWDQGFVINLAEEFYLQQSKDWLFFSSTAMNGNGDIAFFAIPSSAPATYKSFLWRSGQFDEIFLDKSPSGYVRIVHKLDDEENMIIISLRPSGNRYDFAGDVNWFINPKKRIKFIISDWYHAIAIKNGFPFSIGSLPYRLKQMQDGQMYLKPGALIQSLVKLGLPFERERPDGVIDQNSSGYVIGTAFTVYREEHAFLAIPVSQ